MVSIPHVHISRTSWFSFPIRLRALVRRSEYALILLAVLAGGLAGVAVAAIVGSVGFLHHILFGVPLNGHLSNVISLGSPLEALVPVAGGLVLGLTGLLIKKWRPRRPVDPIEANALQGGRMSLIDSLLIVAQTIVSNGAGASVGTEAAYTQISSGLASRIGAAFKLRRSDMRTLVGCGSAGAIGAAFGAPLTGAFYAFELIIGTYTPFGLAPIMAASISGVLVARSFGFEESFIGRLIPPAALAKDNLLALFILAMLCSAIGIGIMRAVTFVEDMFKRSQLPSVLQPAFGGLIVGGLALVTPQVLSAGHGALFQLFRETSLDLQGLVIIVVLKSLASAVSIGSGFRGGLFFAALFLGGAIGKAFAGGLTLFAPLLAPDPAAFAVVGMAALAVAIVGGPLTMSFLALETTGDFPLSIMILAASTIVSVVVRRTFGYSFATWRLHLRGESIRGAHDVSWMRNLTVAKLMRRDVKTATSDMTIKAFAEEFPLGSTQWVVAVDAAGSYAGMVSVADVHLCSADGDVGTATIATLLRFKEQVLLPEMNIKEAADIFEQTESEALAVTDNIRERQVVGLLAEAYVLRRYTEELEKARRELSGENWLHDA
ncbi:MAG: chloride channel protein [Beijerinckiaceae bacterium]